MTDYKATLNLPKTDFPMKANLSQREPDILKKWETLNLYGKLRETGKKQKKFILHDGPPYANGNIHMGTAVNKILKDIVTKSKTLSGFNSPFVPGWDCHGLPIELNVEKKLGKPGQKVSIEDFRKACRDYAMRFIDIQREEFKRLGIIADWEHPYLTMDPVYEANIIRSLAKILKNGHLQKGYRPVYWCLDCSSALAEAEVEYKDKTSPSIDVRFAVVDDREFLSRFEQISSGEGEIIIPIWTTTPWTLPANEAVALNPLLDYVLVQAGQESFLIAEALLQTVMQRYNIEKYTVLGKIRGERLEGVLLQHPFFDKKVPVILGDHVTVESGTGAVHTAPAHGEDDFIIGKKYQLPVENPVADDGCFISTIPLVAGLHVTKANDAILQILKERNALIHLETITHSYPHCWRHKTPLIFRATPQWFISMDKNHLRQSALDAIKRVKWVPDWGMSRIYSMIEKRPDWCVSRQRTWGVPIAVFMHKETGELHPKTAELMEKVAVLVEKHGVDAWYQLDEKSFLGADSESYKKCLDILDVWFDSGVSSECVLRKNPQLGFPADIYLEGSDQHRGWFNSSLLSSIAMCGQEPYKMVLTHGYVIDIEGRKMSKSIGNVILPETVIKTMGADVLRLWVASIDYRNDMNVSDEILKRTSETYRRIRNTMRFLLSNLSDFDPVKHLVKPKKMLALDRWAVDKARLVQQEIIKAYDTYQFHTIYQKIHQFCSIDMGSFYLDIIKDRQYTTQTDSVARRSAQTAIYHIVEALVRWMAPILTFTAEEVWQFIPGKRNESVFLNTWYTELSEISESELMNQSFWDEIRRIREVVYKEIENQRNLGNVGAGLEAVVDLYCEPHLKNKLDELENELRFLFITSGARVHELNSHIEGLVKTELPFVSLRVTPVAFPKCERCWHRRADVGSIASHELLCVRCVENVEGKGEIRKFA